MGCDIVPHNSTELTNSQFSAIASMAGGSNLAEAAKKAGIDQTNVHRWLSDDPRFEAALNLVKQEALDSIRAEIRLGASEAVHTVREIMNNTHAGDSTRLRAALALLDRVGASTPEPIGSTDSREIEAARSDDPVTRLIGKLTGTR